jgi:hypothetical protein
MYTAELSLTNLPSTASANPIIDGTEYGTDSIPDTNKLMLTFLGLTGSTHIVTLSQCILTSEDTRSCTNNNVITISEQGTCDIDYDVKQFMLLIQTEPSSVPGGDERWLTAGQTAKLGPYDDTVPVDAGTRYMLLGLAVDGTMVGEKSLTLTMDRPHIVTVRYLAQHLLKIVTDYGDPKGEGWYNSGDLATYSVTTPCGFLIQRVFVSWAGDITSSEPQGRLTMTRPHVIRANWRQDYTQLILLVLLLAVVAGAVALKARVKRKAPSPSYAQELPKVPTLQTRTYDRVSHCCISCGRQTMQDGISANIVELGRKNHEFVDSKNGGREKKSAIIVSCRICFRRAHALVGKLYN